MVLLLVECGYRMIFQRKGLFQIYSHLRSADNKVLQPSYFIFVKIWQKLKAVIQYLSEVTTMIG